MTSKEMDETIDLIFTAYDKDGSGYLEEEEARKFFEDLFKSTNEDIDQDTQERIMLAIDENEDGQLSKTELKGFLIAALNC